MPLQACGRRLICHKEARRGADLFVHRHDPVRDRLPRPGAPPARPVDDRGAAFVLIFLVFRRVDKLWLTAYLVSLDIDQVMP